MRSHRASSPPPPYLELHARSAFSFHHGASHPEDLVRRAADLGYPALAVTDRDGFHGSARAHYAARELKREQGRDFRALVATELTLEGELVLPVLIRTRAGYQSLCRLITDAKLRGISKEITGRVAEAAEEDPLPGSSFAAASAPPGTPDPAAGSAAWRRSSSRWCSSTSPSTCNTRCFTPFRCCGGCTACTTPTPTST